MGGAGRLYIRGLSLLLQLCQNGRSLSSARRTELRRLYSSIPLALINDRPLTDEQGIAMKVYNGISLALEILVLYVKMTLTWFHCLYQFFVPPEPKSVKGEIILITGAGHGMGRETALRCDVTDREAIAVLAEKIRREVGEVTMLVNNAGIMPCKPLLQTSEKEIRTSFEVNIIAHLWLLQTFLPSMMERNHGHIVAMSSMAGVVGLRNLVPYCATKFAVRGLMEALHEELREDKTKDYSGIKFTVICPYIVDTGLCKNPKVKFPTLMKILTPQEASDQIVDAVRRNYNEITIPSSLYYINMICRVFPKQVPLYLKDFLDSGLEADP
ncbi:hypothetical protein SFRURICE_018630 [Spodoptera frugiperda]|nr:hypothetical protein SFRURICE_018630 [Spodoptera frugiperda]